MALLAAIYCVLFGEPVARVDVVETVGAPYRGAVRCGILLDPGKWSGESRLVARGRGKSLLVQSRVLGRHEDGSARRCELIWPVEIPAGSCVSYEISAVSDAVRDDLADTVEIDDEGDRVAVRTKSLDVILVADPARPIAAFGPRGQKSVIACAGGSPLPRGRLVIEERGPYVVRVLIEGELPLAENVLVGARVRATLDLVGDFVTIETRIANDSWYGKSSGITSIFQTSSPIKSRRWTTAAIGGDAVGRPSAVIVDADAHVAFSGIAGAASHGANFAAGVLRLKTEDATIDFSVRDFEMTGPAVIESDGVQAISATLLSPEYFLSSGVAPERAMRLALVERSRESSPPRPFSQPIGLQKDRAVAWDDAAVTAPETARRLVEFLRAEVFTSDLASGFHWPGAENWGDWRWSRSDAGNLEFDTTEGLFYFGRQLRRGPTLDRAVAAARHLLSRDVDHGRSGLVLRHGAYHRKGGIEAGHMWIDGLIEVAFATCDPFLLEGTRTLAEKFGAYLGRTDIDGWNTRSVAWSLLFSAAAHREFGEVVPEEAIEKLLRRAGDSHQGPWLVVERPDLETGVAAVSTWVTAGILGAGLFAHRTRADVVDLRRRYVATVEMLVREAYDDRAKELADTVEIDRVGGIARKSGVTTGEQALFFATAARWMRPEAPCTASGRRLDEIARMAAKKLQGPEKVFRGMEISQILWAAPRLFGRDVYR